MPAQEHPSDPGRISQGIGRFVVDLDTERWWWSDGIYHLHGFEPGEITPTTELMLAHREAADGEQEEWSLRALAEATATGEPFGTTYRIVDAQGNERTVVVVGSARPAGPDGTREVEGYMLDLTPGERARLEAGVRDAVTSFRDRAATIEQAKGILMELFALPADDAFEVLRDHSNQANVKVHSLAERLVRHGPVRTGVTARPRVGDPVLARRLGLLAADETDDLTVDLRWPSPRHAEITLEGRFAESDLVRIDECVSVVLGARPSVLAVRLDLRGSRGPAAALPALRRALVRFHHAGVAVDVVDVVGHDTAPERPTQSSAG